MRIRLKTYAPEEGLIEKVVEVPDDTYEIEFEAVLSATKDGVVKMKTSAAFLRHSDSAQADSSGISPERDGR